MTDTLLALLYLGKVSRDIVGYSKTPKGKEPDHTWSTFKKMDTAFRAVHPELVPALDEFMKSEKEKWSELFTELFKVNSLAIFVTKHLIN